MPRPFSARQGEGKCRQYLIPVRSGPTPPGGTQRPSALRLDSGSTVSDVEPSAGSGRPERVEGRRSNAAGPSPRTPSGQSDRAERTRRQSSSSIAHKRWSRTPPPVHSKHRRSNPSGSAPRWRRHRCDGAVATGSGVAVTSISVAKRRATGSDASRSGEAAEASQTAATVVTAPAEQRATKRPEASFFIGRRPLAGPRVYASRERSVVRHGPAREVTDTPKPHPREQALCHEWGLDQIDVVSSFFGGCCRVTRRWNANSFSRSRCWSSDRIAPGCTVSAQHHHQDQQRPPTRSPAMSTAAPGARPRSGSPVVSTGC